jgi:outer membrane protein assembly factor BamB
MEQAKVQKIISITRVTALVSLIFIVLISLLLIVNYIQIKKVSPGDAVQISKLINKLNQNPDDEELRQQIRSLDLMSRKALFASHWQFLAGTWLLIGAIVVLVISVKTYSSYKKLDIKISGGKSDYWELKSGERIWLVSGVSIFVVSALILTFLSKDSYLDFSKGNFGEKNNAVAALDDKNLKDSAKSISDTAKAALADSTGKVDLNDFPADGAIRQNHPSFRGPLGQGISFAANTPTEWDGASGKNLVWKATPDLPGLNSPVIWGDKLFVSGADKKNKKIYCYNSGNGKLVWSQPVDKIEGSPAEAPSVNAETGYAAPGLATDGKRVYGIFATGDVICFDFEGNRLWAKNLGVPTNHYGHSSSLMLYQNLLIVQYDHSKTRNLIALEVHTGEVKWNTSRPGKISWSSPILVKHEGKYQVILNNDPYVASYDAATGAELWKIEELTGEIGASPAYANGIVFSANEFAKLVALKLGGIPKVLWESSDYLPDASSPVAWKDWLFISTAGGEVACLNIADGAVLWNHEFDVGFYASPMIADGKLYLLDRMGIMHILKADKEYSLIAECKLGEKSDCTAAFSNGRIYLRGKKSLYCFKK